MSRCEKHDRTRVIVEAGRGKTIESCPECDAERHAAIGAALGVPGEGPITWRQLGRTMAAAAIVLAASVAVAQEAPAPEPGIRLSAIGSAEVVLAAGADRSVRPAADIEVDGPLAVGGSSLARVYARLRVLGLPGESVDLASVETFRAAEVSLGAYKRIGRVQIGDQEIWTSVATEWGFATLPIAEGETAAQRHPRHYGGGLRFEERKSGARLSLLYGRHESAGERHFGQWLVSGSVPLSVASGALVVGGDAVLSVGPGTDSPRQRDHVRLWVGVSLPDLIDAIR